ncbi:GtrA family protein [Sphingomonas sp. Leaf33]|uniref:GtrA family protein n=1 Tax=Sphingomonas sp. Leaf33 TaxID=1736215 RepID=UPI000B2A7271|nr:GtrA family protein [Sphingomonas sp. Leaf33]
MVSRVLHHLNSGGVMGQLIRYAITGGGVTLLGAGLYTGLVLTTSVHPQAAMALAYLVCVAVGYVLHSRWSFRGHGTRDTPGRTTFRFFVASVISYAMNAFWTWACINALGLPEWTPVLPLLFVTPLAMFAINRNWVFK